MEMPCRFYYLYHDIQPVISLLLSILRFLGYPALDLSSKIVVFSEDAKEHEYKKANKICKQNHPSKTKKT